MQILHQANFNNNEDYIGQYPSELHDDARSYSEQFDTLTNEVNINIGNITQIVNQIMIQNAELMSMNSLNEERHANF